MISQALRAGVIFFSPPQPLHHLCTKPLPVKHPATIQDGGIELIQRSVFRSKITPALQASGDGDNRICSANHFYENYLQYFCTTKVIFIILIYKLTKNLPINSPVQRKIPAKNVLVNCINVNRLSTACQSDLVLKRCTATWNIFVKQKGYKMQNSEKLCSLLNFAFQRQQRQPTQND